MQERQDFNFKRKGNINHLKILHEMLFYINDFEEEEKNICVKFSFFLLCPTASTPGRTM